MLGRSAFRPLLLYLDLLRLVLVGLIAILGPDSRRFPNGWRDGGHIRCVYIAST